MATSHKLPALVLVTLAITLEPGTARADEPEARSRQAQALFDRGRDLMTAGDIDQACPLLAESQRLDPGSGTLLNLAVCHDKQRRLALAWTEYHDALSASIRDGRKDRETLASERLAGLEPRLPRLVVKLPETLPDGYIVKVDGAELSRLAAGTPLPVDPGPHEVAATAPGYTSWSTKLASISEGERVEVAVPMLSAVASPPNATPRAHLATGSYVAGGVALASFATMAVTGALALSAQSSANRACDASRDFCEPSNAGDASRARTLAWASTVSLGVALAATVVAVVWPRTGSTDHPTTAARVTLTRAGLGFSF